jgi:CubicO group peptidase (beta-lactamase class C family)
MTIERRTFLGLALVSPYAVMAAANATAEPPDDLHELLTTQRQSTGLPAIAAGVMKEGKLMALGAAGVRKAGTETAVTRDDKFHIGSDTKAMTATVVAMLVGEGKLRWNQTLSDLFPERAAKMNAGYRSVTLEMLLTHRAGMPHDSHDYGATNDPVTVQRLKYLDATINQPPASEPGKFSYSNAGYITVGAILERITSKPWEILIRERLFKPLGMSTAGFGPPSKANTTDQPWGHVFAEGNYQPRYGDNPPALGPAGTVHCSMTDYLKFADFHASSGKRVAGLLAPELVEKLRTPPAGATYAMGWGTGTRDWAKGTVMTHAGSNTMNYFIVWIAPKIEFSVAAAANAAGPSVNKDLDQVVGKLVRRYAA